MIDKTVIEGIVADSLQGTDGFLVEVTVSKDNDIVVEIDSDSGVDIDTCVAINNAIDASLDRDVEDFSLQVGSTGLISPFKVLRQYQKNIGNEVEVLSGGKKFTGVLESAGEEEFSIVVQIKEKGIKKSVPQRIVFKYSDVKYTKYNLKFN
ncbi:MAG: ribosome assembly cofactor RimP [Paludibacteraceae bacterium]|nr:ribosome assembly cofactor RimP [Paludibacteraceae bacterium]